MAYAIQWLRSLIFVGQAYFMLAVVASVHFPLALFNRKYAFRAVHAYCRWVRWTAPWMVGLKTEIRGTPPTDEVLVAAKHQSFLDTILIASAVPHPRYVMKSILKYAPFLGWYGLRVGCVPVDRGKRGKAIEQMVHGVENNPAGPGQLIIYPQGTRVTPESSLPYKVGPAVLYSRLNQPCYPVAVNVGLFWPRVGIYRKPGTAIVEFLEPIAPGLDQREFLQLLEERIESASDALMLEAGFDARKARANAKD